MALCQHVVVARDAESHRTVAPVRDLCIGEGIEVEVDHIVEGTDSALDRVGKVAVILERDPAQREACKVADNEVSWPCRRHDDGIAVLRHDLL